MAVASNTVPNLEKLYECAQTLSNAKGLVQNRVSHNFIRKIYVLAALLIISSHKVVTFLKKSLHSLHAYDNFIALFESPSFRFTVVVFSGYF